MKIVINRDCFVTKLRDITFSNSSYDIYSKLISMNHEFDMQIDRITVNIKTGIISEGLAYEYGYSKKSLF